MARVTMVSVMPGLLGTYGDAGNAIALAHRVRARGHDARILRTRPGDALPSGDIYLLGGAEDRAQPLAVDLIGDALADAVTRGAVVLGVCAGYQILGSTFAGSDGTAHAGLGLLDVTTTRLAERAVGDVVVDPALPLAALVGFENHHGGTRLGPGAQPLGTVRRGIGNGAGTEGAVQGRVLGTYLHGPVLALNPEFADHLLSLVLGPLDPMEDAWAQGAREYRLLGKTDARPTPARPAMTHRP